MSSSSQKREQDLEDPPVENASKIRRGGFPPHPPSAYVGDEPEDPVPLEAPYASVAVWGWSKIKVKLGDAVYLRIGFMVGRALVRFLKRQPGASENNLVEMEGPMVEGFKNGVARETEAAWWSNTNREAYPWSLRGCREFVRADRREAEEAKQARQRAEAAPTGVGLPERRGDTNPQQA